MSIDLERTRDAERRADTLFAAEIERPFDFERGPWVRATVASFGGSRFRFILSLPHIVYDAWSLDLFFRELAAIYAARLDGRVEAPGPPPLQYADFVLWQERERADGREVRSLEYWRARLAGARALAIPFRRRSIVGRVMQQGTRLRTLPGLDRPGAGRWLLRGAAGIRTLIARSRPATAMTRAGHLSIVVPPATVAGLRALARGEGVTLFVVVLAALKTTLAALTGETDVVVATYTANRPWPELRDLMGHLGNTVAIRSDLGGAPSFRGLVRRVGAGWFADQAHGVVPFPDVSRAVTRPGELPLERRLPVVFQLIEALDVVPRLAGIVVTPVGMGTRHRAFRLAVTLVERGDGVTGTLSFDPGLYDASACRRLLDDFCRVLERVASDPDDRLSDLLRRVQG